MQRRKSPEAQQKAETKLFNKLTNTFIMVCRMYPPYHERKNIFLMKVWRPRKKKRKNSKKSKKCIHFEQFSFFNHM